MPKTIAINSYLKLLDKLKKQIAEGLTKAKQAYDKEKIITYWKIGEAIAKHLLKYKQGEAYGKKLFQNLSQDLDIGERLLYQIVEFYKAYPTLPKQINLKWSHYRLLTSVKNQEQRTLFEEKANQDNWSNITLKKNIVEQKEKYIEVKPKKKKQKLSFARGKLYTYKIFKADYTNELLVDLGFNTYKETELKNFSEKIAEVIKVSAGREENYQYHKTEAKKKHLYTYKAYIEKIIDGDTLWVNIDCGFKIWLRQKIRLRGIDTPDIETKEGKQAYKFVKQKLLATEFTEGTEKNKKSKKFIIIKSHGRDKYDRHLVDIFYKQNEKDPEVVLRQGNFLNQELVDENLAEIV